MKTRWKILIGTTLYAVGIVIAGPKWPVVLVRWAAGKDPWND